MDLTGSHSPALERQMQPIGVARWAPCSANKTLGGFPTAACIAREQRILQLAPSKSPLSRLLQCTAIASTQEQ